MNYKRIMGGALLALTVLGLSLPVTAQDEPVASGLNNPRLINYGSDGTLYIAEAGIAGEEEVNDATGFPVNYGPSARVVAVSPDGETQAAVEGLPSLSAFGNFVGVNSVLPGEDGSLWLVIGGTVDVEDQPTRGVLVLNEDGSEQRFIDIGAVEDSENPDGDDIASNPIDIAVSGDTVYVLDASANALFSITGDGEPEVFHAWEDLPVPSSIAVGPEGDIYVGFLSSFPFATGSARIEHWSAEGELVETYGNLTGVTDVAVDADGVVYAVEMSTSFGDQGWAPNAGRVVTVSADGVTPLAEGLNFPYGIAQSPDGTWVVSVNSAFVEPGTGEVIVLSADAGAGTGTAEATEPAETMEAEEPASTPEASG